jgi:Ser/Thr protein kinase RdoA (MazF antagonist)
LLAEVGALRSRLLPLEPLLLPQHVTPARHAHGDLKASNVLFDERGKGLCLVDLDTLAHMAWPFEMGDAIRSWCNPRREDEPGAGIELDLYEAALAGYREGAERLELSPTEIELLPRGVLTIAVELALRFLTDALEERYFSFDPARYATQGEHNLARAKGQIELALSVESALGELERITRRELAQ